MQVLQQMPRTCTQRLNRNSTRSAKPPTHLCETPICASPSNPPSVRHRRTQEHWHIPADHTEPPRPIDWHHTSVLLQTISSRCTSDPSLPSKHSGLSAPKRSAGHPQGTHRSETDHYGTHRSETDYPLSRRRMAIGSSPMGRPAPAAASPLARSLRAKVGEAEHHNLANSRGHPQDLRLHIVRQKIWISTGPSLRHPPTSHLPSTGGAAELSRSGRSWPLPRRCRTTWRCPAAARPLHGTWPRRASRCGWRSPGCP